MGNGVTIISLSDTGAGPNPVASSLLALSPFRSLYPVISLLLPNLPTLGTLATLGATPTRVDDNFVSPTNPGHTQQKIKSSLWGRILRNEPGIITHLIKPYLLRISIVAATTTLDTNLLPNEKDLTRGSYHG